MWFAPLYVQATTARTPRLPAAIADKTLPELQHLAVDLLKKLKQRDKRIEELNTAAAAAATTASAASPALPAATAADGPSAEQLAKKVERLNAQLSEATVGAEALRSRCDQLEAAAAAERRTAAAAKEELKQLQVCSLGQSCAPLFLVLHVLFLVGYCGVVACGFWQLSQMH